MATYKKSVLEYNDVRDAMSFNHEKGLRKGREEGLQKGREETILQIAKVLDMPVNELTKLISSL